MNDLTNMLNIKENEIKDLKQIKSCIPFDIFPGEILMSVIFISFDEKVHISIICKKTDDFARLEKIVYDKYPEYLDSQNYFMVDGKKINRFKNLEENNINDNDIIILKQINEYLD